MQPFGKNPAYYHYSFYFFNFLKSLVHSNINSLIRWMAFYNYLSIQLIILPWRVFIHFQKWKFEFHLAGSLTLIRLKHFVRDILTVFRRKLRFSFLKPRIHHHQMMLPAKVDERLASLISYDFFLYPFPTMLLKSPITMAYTWPLPSWCSISVISLYMYSILPSFLGMYTCIITL